MSSWSKRVLMNVPSPNAERSPLSRFIPREELGDVETWDLGSFGGPRARAGGPKPEPEPPPAGPTEADWLARIEAARQAAYQDGYRDGTVALEGFKKTHAEQLTAQVGAFVRSLDAEFDGLHEQLASTVLRVSLQLARQVVRCELQARPELVATVATEAVEAVLRSARHITVQVHAQDLPLVAAGAAEVLKERGARVVAHPAVARGGCRIESDVGAVDADIASRWAQAALALGSEEAWDGDGDADAVDAAGEDDA